MAWFYRLLAAVLRWDDLRAGLEAVLILTLFEAVVAGLTAVMNWGAMGEPRPVQASQPRPAL